MSRSLTRTWLAWVLLLPLTSIQAHHSVSGQFDSDARIELTGVISRIDWINPHTYIYLDVRDAQGETVTWRLETAPTAMLRKAGLTQEMIMADGATVVITGIRARDGTQHLGWIYRISYPDGHFYELSRPR